MNAPAYPTPDDAEDAFYRAFELAAVDTMMSVWDDDDMIACIHPMGKIVTGLAAVRESWAQLFDGDQRMHFKIQHHQRRVDDDFAVHMLTENIYLPGDTQPRPPILATNIYRRTDSGWRMILHHSSPSVIDASGRRPDDSPGHQLH